MECKHKYAKRCPIQFERTLDEQGRYLGHFRTKEEAEKFVEEQIRRYLYTPDPKKMSIRRICKEAQDQGIKLHPATFASELKRRGIEIRDFRNRKKTTIRKTFTISKNAWSQLQTFPNGSRSFIVDLGLKAVMGIPTENIAVFIPNGERQITLIFEKKSEHRYQFYVSEELDTNFKQRVQRLLQQVEEQGIQAVIEYANEHGYDYVGGTHV